MGFFIGLLIVGILGGVWVVYELIAMIKKNQIDYDKVAEFRKMLMEKCFARNVVIRISDFPHLMV